MTYTEEQIQWVCDKSAKLLKEFSDMKSCMFPSGPIIEGMKTGLTVEEIGAKAFDSITEIPVSQTSFNENVAQMSMHNIAIFMQGKIMDFINNVPTAII